MSAGERFLDELGGDPAGDVDAEVDADRDSRVQDAVDQFNREQIQADIGSIEVDDMLPDAEPQRDSREETASRPRSNGQSGSEPTRNGADQTTGGAANETDTSDAVRTGVESARQEAEATEPTAVEKAQTAAEGGEVPGSAQRIGPGPEVIEAGETARGLDAVNRREELAERTSFDPKEIRLTRIENADGTTQLSAVVTPDTEAKAAATERLEAAIEDEFGQDVAAGDEFEVVEQDGRFVAEIDPEFVRDATAEPTETPPESAVEGAADVTTEQRQRAAEQERQDALEGIGAFDEQAEIEQEQLEELEAQLEQQIGEQRAAEFGAVDQAQYRQIIERTDLERGEDFTIETGEQETRTFTDPETGEQVTRTTTPLRAELTEEFEREFTEELAGFNLAQQFGTEFEPGQDFQLTDEGDVELTDTGAQKAQTQNIRGFVADLESRVFDVPGLGQFQVDVPGEGPLVETAEKQDLGTGAEALRVRAGPEDEFMTLQEALSAGADIITDATEVSELAPIEATEPGRGRSGAAARQEEREFTGAGRDPVAQASSAVLRTPAFLLEGLNLGIDAAEFGAEVAGTADVQADPTRGAVGATFDEERLNDLFGGLETATLQRLTQAADVAAEDPGEFAARGVGSIIGTAGLFAGARAAGRLPSGAARGLIQPGEEIAGIGGNRLTRLVAGERTAERLFPQNEPLIFSEEAALRRLGQAGRRTQEAGVATRARLAEEAVGARFRLAELTTGEVPTRPLDVGERLARARTSLEFRAAELDPRSEVQRPRGVTRRTAERLAEQTQDIVDRIEVDSGRIGAGAGAIPEVRLRPRAETEAESEQDVLERFDQAEAQQPSVEADTETETLNRMRRAETTALDDDLLDEPTARRVAAEASEARERARTDLRGSELGSPAFDAELDELLEPALDQEQRLDIDSELDQRFDLEDRTEQRGETRLETEVEIRQEPTELELQQEVEAEAESETEQEQRQEQRAEAEAELVRGSQLLEEEKDFLATFFGDEEFESGIAGQGESAIEAVERELLDEFEAAEGGDANLGEFQDAERDILEG